MKKFNYIMIAAAAICLTVTSCRNKKEKTREERVAEFRAELTQNDTTEMLKLADNAMELLNSGWTRHQYNINEVDFFATFYDNKCYLVPCYQCSNEKTLRIFPPKNGQTKGVSFLKDYEASEVLKTL